MGAVTSFPFDSGEPLGFVQRAVAAPETYADLRAFLFEFSSRGDRVPGRLLLPPEGGGPFPLVLLQHGAGGAKDAPYLDATAGPWGRGGVAVASIDFPLHGQRTSAKLTELLLRNLHPPSQASEDVESLVREFVHQAVVDLRRALDALEPLSEIDGERVAYAGFSLGTLVGATFCGIDPRPQAAAFAIGGGGMGPPEIDPARTVGSFAPRPALFVNATRDEVVSREAALALFEGGGEPKELLWFEGTHSELPGEALKAMWLFLKRHLGVT
jgi:predicted alpha/beta-hydrolase family hydrolase